MKYYLCDVCDISKDRVTIDRTLVSKDHAWKWPIDGILKIPNHITDFDDMSFAGRTDINSIEIPHSIRSISGRLLLNFSNLTSITIPHWTYINESTFLPRSLKVINVKYVNPDMIGHANRRIINTLEAAGISRWKFEINFLDENGEKI